MSVARRLCGALSRSAAAAGARLAISASDSVPWASGLFEGERHAITAVGVRSAAMDAWITALADVGLAIAGHIVDDVLVADRRTAGDDLLLRIEALTIVRADVMDVRFD